MYNKVIIEITPDAYTKTLYKNDGTVAESVTMKRRKNGLLTSDKSWDDVRPLGEAGNIWWKNC